MAELDHLSYSSISLYSTCPRAWEYKYVKGVTAPTSVALAFGSAFHTAVETIIGAKTAATLVGADIPTIWNRVWNQTTEGKEINWEGELPEEQSNLGLRMLTSKDVQKVIEGIVPAKDADGQPVIEKRVELRVPGVSVPIVGYIDVISADGVPGDFKTASRMWSGEQAEKELQPLFYLAALSQENYQTTPERWFRHYVFTKTKTPQAAVFPTKHAAGQLFWLFGMVQAVWKGIEAGVFPPNPGSWKCSEKYCDSYRLCRGKQ